jgi:segregation and condensation protein A
MTNTGVSETDLEQHKEEQPVEESEAISTSNESPELARVRSDREERDAALKQKATSAEAGDEAEETEAAENLTSPTETENPEQGGDTPLQDTETQEVSGLENADTVEAGETDTSEEQALAEPGDPAAVSSGVATIGINGVVLSLNAFEGPMHLLMHLIHEQNIDIFDIPIHKIANDFQAYVDLIHTLDLDLAGDYLTMAAELMAIKSRMLLPREKDDEDPRDDLVQRLLEYKQVRNATRFLKKQKKLGEDVFIRGTDAVSVLPDLPLPKARVQSNELMGIFAKMLSKFAHTQGPFHAINFEKITVRQQIDWVCGRFGEEHEELMFSELFTELGGRLEIIVTFLALLELSRLKHLRLEMTDEGDDICVRTTHSLVGLELGEIDSFDYSAEQQQVGKSPKSKSKS